MSTLTFAIFTKEEDVNTSGSMTNLLLFSKDITRISVQKRDCCSRLHGFSPARDELVVLAENRRRGK